MSLTPCYTSFLRFQVWAANLGLSPLLSCLCGLKGMGPYGYVVHNGYIRILDEGPILRAHGLASGSF